MMRTVLGLIAFSVLMLSIAPGAYAQERIGVGLVTAVDVATSTLTLETSRVRSESSLLRLQLFAMITIEHSPSAISTQGTLSLTRGSPAPLRVSALRGSSGPYQANRDR